MRVEIDSNAGFCFGVVKAISKAEEELAHRRPLLCLGDLVHNNAEVSRLSEMGLEVIDHERFRTLRDTKVLIRAHGEPPSTYDEARQRNINLVDATCPIVLALQKNVRSGYEEMKRVGGQVLIFGKHGHAEVIGLNGQTDNTAIIISGEEDLDGIDFSRPVRLYSQTTQSRDDYRALAATIKSKMLCDDFEVYDTVCRRVANRADELKDFARSVDLLLFVSGATSSNGKYLFEYCSQVQPNTKFISDVSQIDGSWLRDVATVGITGATSTPRWLMEKVANYISQGNREI
ncbi:MAG: 4-hydroxy-3-methylbut-2-enyl diphosphate reductase [Bacteroidales bacterium]|nr:4-hydroxy-3-methylbut-2-enyl diphosphate reductase [Bacteroidales bacterium]